jgi:hypothetical protein
MENLGFVLESMALKSMSKKDLVNKIVDEVLTGRDLTSAFYRSPTSRIKGRVDFYANKYGNLGVSRRKLVQLASKELKRRENRTRRDRYKARWG